MERDPTHLTPPNLMHTPTPDDTTLAPTDDTYPSTHLLPSPITLTSNPSLHVPDRPPSSPQYSESHTLTTP